jgi:hypothetical protein
VELQQEMRRPTLADDRNRTGYKVDLRFFEEVSPYGVEMRHM